MSTASATANAAALSLTDGFSLEMTGKDVASLREARHLIPVGTRINVTFLGNEDLEMRVAAAKAAREMSFVPIPHISARRLRSRTQLEEFLMRLRDVDAVDRVFVVGGDPVTPQGPYEDSVSLIRSGLLTDHGVREVGFAGYPEGHPTIAHETLWNALDSKSALLAEQELDKAIITQFAFDTSAVAGWIGAVRERGIAAPIRVGAPGPAGITRLLGFARRFGISTNASIVKKYGLSLTNLMGTAGPDRFVNDLANVLTPSAGDVRLHLYTFGGLFATSEWARDFIAGSDGVA